MRMRAAEVEEARKRVAETEAEEYAPRMRTAAVEAARRRAEVCLGVENQ